MKKLLVIALAIFSFFIFNACGTQIPDDATIAVCPQGTTFKYIYKEDKVYEFYSDDVLQSKDMLDIVQSAVDGYGNTLDYLNATFQEGVCTFTTYNSSKE